MSLNKPTFKIDHDYFLIKAGYNVVFKQIPNVYFGGDMKHETPLQ